MKLKLICTLISAIYFGCLLANGNDDSTGAELFSFKFNNGCLDAGTELKFGNLSLNAIRSNANCVNDSSSVKWQARPSGEFTIEDERFANGTMCLDCLNELAGCLLVGRNCTGDDNQKFFIKPYPNQGDGEKGHFYFSIFSAKHPGKCLTYEDNPRNLTRKIYPQTAIEWNQELNNSFRLDECTGAANQTFSKPELPYSNE